MSHSACLDLPNLLPRLGSSDTVGYPWLIPKDCPSSQCDTNGLGHILLQDKPSFDPGYWEQGKPDHKSEFITHPAKRLSFIMAFDCLTLRWFWRHSSSTTSNTGNQCWMCGISLLAHSLQLGLCPWGASGIQQKLLILVNIWNETHPLCPELTQNLWWGTSPA